jgi:ABC-type branched-subunit amino acid transport system substrate-binding protein
MNFPAGFRKGFLAAAAGVVFAIASAQALALTDAEKRGKQIYLRGTSDSGSEINALVGREGVALPASALPCASCHGPDGRGRPEGGIIPPDVRWSELTKVYGHVHEEGRRQGRRHPAFDEENFAKLIRTGVDPGDNRLDQSMPIYQMPEGDMADLIAYMKRLETDFDPGLSDDRIQIGTLLPLSGSRGKLGQAMAQVLHAHFQEINDGGGIFGRRLELLAIPFGADAESTLANLRLALRTEGIFALVGAYTVGLDQAVLDLLREEDVPLVGPFTLDPGNEIANAAVFYLYSGFDEQARVLAEAALEESAADAAPPVIVGAESERIDRLVEAVQEQLARDGKQDTVSLRYRSGELDAAAIAQDFGESDTLFFFGGQGELDSLLAALDARQARPRVYVLSSFVSRPLYDVPAGFNHKIVLAYPTLGSDISKVGRTEYQALARVHALPPDHVQAQIAAFAAAKLLEEGLRRAGRTLNRLELVDALEALYAYETGLTPPLTYGPNRRIGARGAHLVTVDLMKKSYQPVGGWHKLR